MSERESIGRSLAFEFSPAAILGSAVAYATATFSAQPLLGLVPVLAGAGIFGATWLLLKWFAGLAPGFSISQFAQTPAEYEQSSLAELLEEADVVGIVERLGSTGDPSVAEVLVLEEVAQADISDSRVVQLFRPGETAGEMQARIETHLRSSKRSAPPDATQELHDALAALRRSLR